MLLLFSARHKRFFSNWNNFERIHSNSSRCIIIRHKSIITVTLTPDNAFPVIKNVCASGRSVSHTV